MSTLQTSNLKNPSSASNNVVLGSSGQTTVNGDLLFNSGYGSAATAYGCRAWVNFSGTGVVAIRASGNVSSITDNGANGDYTVNFTTAMPDANYAVAGTGCDTSAANLTVLSPAMVTTPLTTTGARVQTRNAGSGALIDCALNSVSIFR